MTATALDPVLAHIDANRDGFLDRLIAYCRHPSISAENRGIGEVAALLQALLTKIGLETTLVPTSGHPVVLARWEKAPGKPTVLLYGHYDVQPPDPLEKWTSPPFEPTVRDGRLFARGVADNKGQHLAQILAIESHLKVHGALPCNVILLLEGEEEIGSPHLAAFAEQHGALLKADFAVTADGPRNAGRPQIKFGSRGVLSFDLAVRHARRDVHSGNYGGVVPNPLWTLVHLLATMKSPAGEITIDGFHDGIVPPSPAERAALAAMPLDIDAFKAELGLSHLDAPADRGFYERLCFFPTLTINGLHGGYGGPGSKTVLPNEAIAKCDARLVAGQTPAHVLACIRAHVARHAPEVEVVAKESGMEPSRTPIDSPFAAPVIRAIATAEGEQPLLVPAGFGSLPNYVFTRILGIPAFVTPYADADSANHAPDENMRLTAFHTGIRIGAALLHETGAMAR